MTSQSKKKWEHPGGFVLFLEGMFSLPSCNPSGKPQNLWKDGRHSFPSEEKGISLSNWSLLGVTYTATGQPCGARMDARSSWEDPKAIPDFWGRAALTLHCPLLKLEPPLTAEREMVRAGILPRLEGSKSDTFLWRPPRFCGQWAFWNYLSSRTVRGPKRQNATWNHWDVDHRLGQY